MPPKTRATYRAAADARQAIIGILSRPGALDVMADEIHEVYIRAGWKAPANTETPARCQNPDGPHPGTALVSRSCPICQWSPGT